MNFHQPFCGDIKIAHTVERTPTHSGKEPPSGHGTLWRKTPSENFAESFAVEQSVRSEVSEGEAPHL